MESDGESFVWVKVPALTANAVFYMHWKRIATEEVTAVDPTKVWTKYIGVWHLGEDSGTAFDSTANHFDATVRCTGEASTNAKVGRSRVRPVSTADNGDYLETESVLLAGTTTAQPMTDMSKITLSGWVYAAVNSENYRIFFRKRIDSDNTSFNSEMSGSNKKFISLLGSAGQVNGKWAQFASQSIEAGKWHHYVLVADGDKARLYKDGVKQGADQGFGGINDTLSPIMFAGESGCADEFRIYNGAGSDARIEAEYAMQAEVGYVRGIGSIEGAFDPASFVESSKFHCHAKLTVGGYEGSTELQGFPVLVRLSEAKIPGFKYSKCGKDGGELCFTDVDEDVCPYEIDTWNPKGESCVWVRVPTISGKTTTFDMHWKLKQGKTFSPMPSSEVWTKYVGVWHLGEDSGTAFDSTANGIHAADTAGDDTDKQALGSADAIVGRSRHRPAGTDKEFSTSVTKLTDTTLEQPLADETRFTVSGWVRADTDVDATYKLASKGGWNASKGQSGWYINAAGNRVQMDMIGHSKKQCKFLFKNKLGYNLYERWIHFVCIYDNGTATEYANRTSIPRSENGNPVAYDNPAFNLTFGAGFGYMDELRIRDGAVSQDWAQAEYDTQTVADFVTFGAVTDTSPKGLVVSFL